MKPAYVAALFIIVLSFGVVIYAFTGSISRHVSIREAIQRPGENLQVPGKIVKESVKFDPLRGELRFDVTEMTGPGRMTIVLHEAKPENFDSATSVEAIGKFSDGVFHADSLLVKCPSKYNDQQPAKTADSEGISVPVVIGASVAVCALVALPIVILNRSRS